MRKHHQFGNEIAQETNQRDTSRASDVHQVLAAAGIPLGGYQVPDEPAHVNVEKPRVWHAVDLHMWARYDDDPAHPDVRALADRIDAALWAAGYLVHRDRTPVMRAYRRDWGGDLPEARFNSTAEVAAYLGIEAGTWRSYVARNQAPAPDGHHSERSPWWYVATIDTWRRDRPGQGARTDRDRDAE